MHEYPSVMHIGILAARINQIADSRIAADFQHAACWKSALFTSITNGSHNPIAKIYSKTQENN